MKVWQIRHKVSKDSQVALAITSLHPNYNHYLTLYCKKTRTVSRIGYSVFRHPIAGVDQRSHLFDCLLMVNYSSKTVLAADVVTPRTLGDSGDRLLARLLAKVNLKVLASEVLRAVNLARIATRLFEIW